MASDYIEAIRAANLKLLLKKKKPTDAEAIKIARLKLNYSQAKTAGILGVSKRFLEMREIGKKPVEPWLFRAIRDLLTNPQK